MLENKYFWNTAVTLDKCLTNRFTIFARKLQLFLLIACLEERLGKIESTRYNVGRDGVACEIEETWISTDFYQLGT